MISLLLPPETGIQGSQKLIERFDQEIIHLYWMMTVNGAV